MAGGFIDYSGRRIGSWTILEPVCDPGKTQLLASGAPAGYTGKWAVACTCGRRFVRPLWPILNGRSGSCSECQKVRTRKRQQTWNAVDMARHAAEKLNRPQARFGNTSQNRASVRLPRREVAPQSEPPAKEHEAHDTIRSLLMSAVRTWVLAQHLPQRVIADRLQVPRAAVSDIVRRKSSYAAEKLLDLWAALGGRWELRLTLGDPGEKEAPAPHGPRGSGTL